MAALVSPLLWASTILLIRSLYLSIIFSSAAMRFGKVRCASSHLGFAVSYAASDWWYRPYGVSSLRAARRTESPALSPVTSLSTTSAVSTTVPPVAAFWAVGAGAVAAGAWDK